MSARLSSIRATASLLGVAAFAASVSLVAQQPPPAQGATAGQQPARPQAAGFPRTPPLPFPTAPQTFDTLGSPIRAVPVAGGLTIPWGIGFLPDGTMLVTEKPGRLRVVRDGKLEPQAVEGVPQVWTEGQGGLFEVAAHPDYASNQLLYLSYAKPGERGATTALARGKFDGKRLTELKDLFVAENWGTGRPHFGGKIVFGRDGFLYLSMGERGERDKAQDLSLHNGKILRLTLDGAPAPGNPFAGQANARPEIWSYGHRNVQGMALDAEGVLWNNEHGPQGGDELNRVQAGKNYGWPVATYGREYSGEVITPAPTKEGIESPVIYWVPSIGISGMAVYTGDRFTGWKGNVFVGGLSAQHIQRVVFTEKGPVGRETLLGSMRLRIRDVRQGPDGLLYLAAEGADSTGGILRLEPAQAATTSAGR